MTIGGWIFMLFSLAFVWGLAGWCYYRVLTAPAPTAGPTPEQPSGQTGEPGGPGTAGEDPGAPPR